MHDRRPEECAYTSLEFNAHTTVATVDLFGVVKWHGADPSLNSLSLHARSRGIITLFGNRPSHHFCSFSHEYTQCIFHCSVAYVVYRDDVCRLFHLCSSLILCYVHRLKQLLFQNLITLIQFCVQLK